MGMRVVVSVNHEMVSYLDLQRLDPGDPTPGVGRSDYRATLWEGPDPTASWIVKDHDRLRGVWGLIVDAMAQRPD